MRKRCHATAVLVVLVSAISMVGCSKDSSSEDQAGAGQSDLYVFDSLEQMVATAVLVVVGEVKGIKAGRVAGDPGPSGNGQIQFLDAQIAVENILKGEAGSDVTVEVDEFFLPFEEGTQGVFFLRATDSAPGHVLMSSTAPCCDGAGACRLSTRVRSRPSLRAARANRVLAGHRTTDNVLAAMRPNQT